MVAAFLGGLAIGAAVGGRIATTLSPRRCLQIYVGLEIAVATLCAAAAVRVALVRAGLAVGVSGRRRRALPLIRIVSCIVMVMLPALALGATFPMAIRWFARRFRRSRRGRAARCISSTPSAPPPGSLLAGFVLIPSIGMSGTIYVAMAATHARGGLRQSFVIEPYDS